jgi:hypothetical protein
LGLWEKDSKVLRKVFVWRCKLSAPPIKKDIRVIRISTREVSVSEGGDLWKVVLKERVCTLSKMLWEYCDPQKWRRLEREG